jgi:RNA polymerase sigma factor for flagellar operon FliA
MYTAQGVLAKDQLVDQYAPLVKRIAFLLLARLPANVDVNDLIQNGMLGLLDALGRYTDVGAQFETYAAQRIRGAMLDGLRENDWVPRGVRREMRRVEAAIQSLEHANGRPPAEAELAAALGMPLDEYQKLLFEARGHQLVYVEDLAAEGEDYLEHHATESSPDPLSLLEEEDMRKALVAAIDGLPEREKLLMGLYYEQDLNLREIGAVLGVSESRVCQLHSQAVARLRSALQTNRPAAAEKKPRKPRSARHADESNED